MQSLPIEFGPWFPDRANLGNAGLIEAKNVVPAENKYGPFPSFNAIDLNAATAPLRGFVAYPNNGQPIAFMGDAENLYRRGNGFASINSGFSANYWEFEQWGEEVLAVSNEGLYYADIQSGSFTLQANAPSARHIKRIENFVFLGGADGVSNRVQWSGFNDRSTWGVDVTSQADFQDMPSEFGAVTGFAAAQYATIFQERAVSRLTYVGPPTIFRIDQYETNKGCVAPNSIVSNSFLTFFIAQDGPNVWDGQSAQPIANGKYRKWFADQFNEVNAASIRSAIDWRNNCIIWLWPVDGNYTRGLVYSWEGNNATNIELEADLRELLYAPQSLVDAPEGERPSWGDGLLTLSGINSDGIYGEFTGPNLEATIQTGELQLAAQRRAMLSEVWPIIDAENITARIGAREARAGGLFTWNTEQPMGKQGMIPCRNSAQVHTLEITIPSQQWSHAQGVEVRFRPEGRK